MNDLIEIPVSGLTPADVGERAVITQDGVGFDGILAQLDVTRSDYNFKDRPRVTARLVLKTFADDSDRPSAEIQLRELPLDYLIQIERKGHF